MTITAIPARRVKAVLDMAAVHADGYRQRTRPIRLAVGETLTGLCAEMQEEIVEMIRGLLAMEVET